MKEKERKGFRLRAIFLTLLMAILMVAMGMSAVFIISGKSPVKLAMTFLGQDEQQAGEPQNLKENHMKELAKVNQQLKDAEEEIASLEKMLDSKEQELIKSEHTITQLESRVDELTKTAGQKEKAEGVAAATFEEMTPKRAALLLEKMAEDDAAEVLSALKTETRAAIMEKMDPALAAALIKKI